MASNDTSSTKTVHPLRAAVEAAKAELEAAEAAREALDDDDSVQGDDPRYEAAEDRETAAEEALEEAREALEGSDCPREWILREEGYDYETIVATSARAALAEARGNVDRSSYDVEGTVWIDVSVRCEETGEERDGTVQLSPEEPDCIDDEDHDWQSPHELVGGCDTNPGVWGSGGGVVIHEACIRCGCRRTTDTWAQRPDTGEQGLTSVEYERGYYDVSAYAAAEYREEVADAGCSEAIEAAAWVLRGLRSVLAGEGYADTPAGTPHGRRIDDVGRYMERVYLAVSVADEDRALRLALRLAARGEREGRIAAAVISAQWPRAARAAA